MPTTAAPSLQPKGPRRRTSASSSCSSFRNHLHPSEIVDILVLVLVISSSAFLLASFSSHILCCLHHVLLHDSPAFFYSSCFLSFLASALTLTLTFQISSHLYCSRRCRNRNCKGLRKAMEFDVQLQTEECLLKKKLHAMDDDAEPDDGNQVLAWKDIEHLSWKGGGAATSASASVGGLGKAGRPDYQCLKDELRKIAPPNGRAVLLCRGRCGCPLAKLEVCGPKRGRRHKKAMATVSLDGEK